MSKHDAPLEVLKIAANRVTLAGKTFKAEADELQAKADAKRAQIVENDKVLAQYNKAIAKLEAK